MSMMLVCFHRCPAMAVNCARRQHRFHAVLSSSSAVRSRRRCPIGRVAAGLTRLRGGRQRRRPCCPCPCCLCQVRTQISGPVHHPAHTHIIDATNCSLRSVPPPVQPPSMRPSERNSNLIGESCNRAGTQSGKSVIGDSLSSTPPPGSQPAHNRV